MVEFIEYARHHKKALLSFSHELFQISNDFDSQKLQLRPKNKIKMKRKKSLGNSHRKLWHTFQDILLHSSSSFPSSFAYLHFDVFCSNRLSRKYVTRVSSLSKARRQKDIEVICLEASLNYRKYATCSVTDHWSPFSRSICSTSDRKTRTHS